MNAASGIHAQLLSDYVRLTLVWELLTVIWLLHIEELRQRQRISERLLKSSAATTG